MIKYYLILIFVLVCASLLFSAPVSQDTVSVVAQNWWQHINKSGSDLQTQSIQLVQKQNLDLYYIINAKGGGFILVSANDAVNPILGYSNKGSFVYPISSPEVAAWMEMNESMISEAIGRNETNTESLAEWNDLLSGRYDSWRNTRNVDPLLITTWDQGTPYNALCPVDAESIAGGHAWAGCGAAAMASVMRYWGYPAHGTGSRSYNNPPYGTLSANFGTTYYNWDNMPTACTAENLDIPLLMYHCGIALTTSFGQDVSTFQTLNFPTAMNQYFGYNYGNYRNRFQYSDSEWEAMITANIDDYKPVVYIAAHSSISHLFILDGYQNTDYFHINWCWGGNYDGYYYLDNLNPGGVLYSGGHAAVFDIYPTASVPIHPSGLTSTLVSNYRIDLHWQDLADNETGFQIERKIGSTGTWAQIATPAANATSYQDLDISSYTTYYYRVRAYNANGGSSWSNEVYSITSGIITPVQLHVNELGSNQFNLSWSSSPNAALYRIYNSDLPLSPDSPDWVPMAETSSLSYPLITSFTRRFYQVTALSAVEMPASFVQIPAGTFNNGVSNVTLSSYYIDKYEVTQDSYLYVMGTNPSQFTSDPNHPVEKVSWFKAIEYCNRRSILEGLIPCYSYSTYGTDPDDWPAGWNTTAANHTNIGCNWTAGGYRLPTEMEWQYAAKGANQSLGYTYSGGNDIEPVAWYYTNAGSTTHPVGMKTANEKGLFDMSGNAFEWVWDIYATPYPPGPLTNPHGAVTGTNRVRRGGGFGSTTTSCTIASRGNSAPTSALNYSGFRVIRIAP